MIVTIITVTIGRNEVFRQKPVAIFTLSTINLTRTDLGSSPGLSFDRPTINRPDHGTNSEKY